MKKILRTYVLPLMATAIAVAYTWQFRCQGIFWWLVFLGVVLATHYLWFFKKQIKKMTVDTD